MPKEEADGERIDNMVDNARVIAARLEAKLQAKQSEAHLPKPQLATTIAHKTLLDEPPCVMLPAKDNQKPAAKPPVPTFAASAAPGRPPVPIFNSGGCVCVCVCVCVRVLVCACMCVRETQNLDCERRNLHCQHQAS